MRNIIDQMPDNLTVSGTVTALAGTVDITLPGGAGTVGLQVTGTWVGQLEFEGSVDGTNYQSVEASNGSATINATAANDIFILPGAGYAKLRVRASAWTSGTAVVTFISSVGANASIITGSLPAGANMVGAAKDAGSNFPVAYTTTSSADMQTAADLTAAPTTGQKLVIDDIFFGTDTAMTFTFQEESSSTVIIGGYFAANNGITQATPRGIIRLPVANKKLMGKASAAGNVYITIAYHSST